jgi:carboxylesterase
MKNNQTLVNTHLEGGSFFWEAGETGILLCHGYTATTAEVRPLAQALHERGYTVSGPLLPGHGTKPEDMNRCRWQDWYAAVESAYNALAARSRRVVVGGESLGSLLTLLLASRTPAVAGVLSYAPAIELPSRRLVLFGQLVGPLLAPFLVSLPKKASEPSAAEARWQGYPVNPIRSAMELLRLQKETRRALPSVRQPALVMQGRLDRSISPRSAKIVYAEIGSEVKELHWLEKSTHCLILDCEWDEAARLTIRFLENIVS